MHIVWCHLIFIIILQVTNFYRFHISVLIFSLLKWYKELLTSIFLLIQLVIYYMQDFVAFIFLPKNSYMYIFIYTKYELPDTNLPFILKQVLPPWATFCNPGPHWAALLRALAIGRCCKWNSWIEVGTRTHLGMPPLPEQREYTKQSRQQELGDTPSIAVELIFQELPPADPACP